MQHERQPATLRQFRFSHRQIDALPPHDADSASAMAEYSDTEVVGLKLSVSKSGRRYFLHRYRFRGKKKALKLGEYPSVSVQDARNMVHEHKNMLARDLDPADERNKRRKVPTLAEFAVNTYLPHAKQRKKSWQDDEAKIRRDIGTMLGHLPINEITTRDVMQLHSSIAKRASAATANRYRALLSTMLNLAVKCDIVEKNPVSNVEKFKEADPRERYLSGDELGRFLMALNVEAGKTTANAIVLLLLTGLRKMELFSLQWAQTDLNRGTLRLLTTKGGRGRTVVLNSMALEILRKIQESADPACPWVFPAHRGGGHLIDPRRALKRAMTRANITDLRPHDLRRSFASLAVNAGVDLYQVKDLLGHSTVAVTQRAYAHLQQDTLRSASEIVARTVGEASSNAIGLVGGGVPAVRR
ncbi:tyrosine-type recombinase/integrase [Geobacter anodireducens]|uniref:Tyrosine-type recombinase/integrase n=1 Tax=Geobacter anodireducens TaxID=1340425 RepID=A0ABR9NZ93_9BACT|nr:site-specific integrase [Geobacter anodireducens]MBE2889569.1 tyrosine-type recombinase/integrase [Geobacter anodireducens]